MEVTDRLDFIEMAMEGVLGSMSDDDIKELVTSTVVGIA